MVAKSRVSGKGDDGSDVQALGVPATETHTPLQTDCFKELVNKIAWVLGSTYRQPYSAARSPVRLLAVRLAGAVLRSEGYPSKIRVSTNGESS